jgi:SAM-dependent methyltransferase
VPAQVTASRGDIAAYNASRVAVLGSLTGTVLEIGAGAGANFGYFRPDIHWLGLEPAPGRRRDLAAAAAAHGQHAPVIAAAAEQIPLADASVDAVVATLVLCSVADQDQVLAEVRRVLRPGGRFAFFEHVAARRGTWSRRLQRCVAPVTRRLDAGCDPARETWRAIRAAGFREVHARWYSRRALLGIYSPCMGGVAHV